jgi:hypothetical protein
LLSFVFDLLLHEGAQFFVDGSAGREEVRDSRPPRICASSVSKHISDRVKRRYCLDKGVGAVVSGEAAALSQLANLLCLG